MEKKVSVTWGERGIYLAKRTKEVQLSSALPLREEGEEKRSGTCWPLAGYGRLTKMATFPGAEKVMVQKHQRLLALRASSQWSDRMLCSRAVRQL